MFLLFDTETTGLPAKGQYQNPSHAQTPKLVEIAAVLFNAEGTELDSYTAIVKPYGFDIPVQASNVHKITTERAQQEGQDLEVVYSTFLNLVKQAQYLVAHNAQYDKLVLDRVDIDLKSFPPFTEGKKILCTKELTTNICRLPSPYGRGFKWPSLQEAHRHFFDCEFEDAHSALADVRATGRVLFELIKQGYWKP